MVRNISFAIVVLVAAAACGNQAAATGTPPPQPAGHTAAASVGQAATEAALTTPGAPAGAGSSAVHVVIGSGPQAGTYDSTGAKSDCNLSPTGSGATYIDTTKTDGVTSFIFTSVEGGAQVAKFYAQALFGPFTLQQSTVEINTLDAASASGSGTATMQDNGATIKWAIDGKSADGVAMTATIECGPVDRR
jgi:hypothetical protein